MLSIFPQLFFLEQLSPLFLRLILGVILTMRGYKKFKTAPKNQQMWIATILEFVGGVLLFIGLFTQLAAIFAVLDRAGAIYKNRSKNWELNLLILVAAFSLIFLGAGLFAFDVRF